jgi:hypothetical protein
MKFARCGRERKADYSGTRKKISAIRALNLFVSDEQSDRPDPLLVFFRQFIHHQIPGIIDQVGNQFRRHVVRAVKGNPVLFIQVIARLNAAINLLI